MILTQILLVFGCVLFGVFFTVDAAFYYLAGNEEASRKRIQRRLKGQTKSTMEASASLKRQNADEDSTAFFLDRYLSKKLRLADSSMTLKNIYFFVFAMTFALGGALYYLAPAIPLLAGLFAGLLLSVGLIIVVLKKQIASRNYKFEEQLPDAIELIVRSLRVGQPFTKAIHAVAHEMPNPIAKEFLITSNEIAYGRNLSEALGDMLKRVSVTDLRFFVVAVQIQNESGGNLAEILENLSKIIRGRFRLMRKVKALTVEGRFSAWFLSAFPLFMIVVMNMINPGYYEKVADFEYFNHLVALTVSLLIVNVIAMRMMTKIEV